LHHGFSWSRFILKKGNESSSVSLPDVRRIYHFLTNKSKNSSKKLAMTRVPTIPPDNLFDTVKKTGTCTVF